MEEVYNTLREKHTGRCKKSGKLFGELMHHFIIGLDKMCRMNDVHGNMKVIAVGDKKKHKKLPKDCGCSTTIVHAGTFGGTTGPTIFLLAKEKRKEEFLDNFLERYDCTPGSTIIMI